MESAARAIDAGAEDDLPSAGPAVESLPGTEGPGAASEGPAPLALDEPTSPDCAVLAASSRTIDNAADSIVLRFFCWSSSRAGSPSAKTAESADNPCAEPASFCAWPSTESAATGRPAAAASGRSGGSPLSGWWRLGDLCRVSSNPDAARRPCATSLTPAELTMVSLGIGWERRTSSVSLMICANEERSVAELMGDRLDRSYGPGFCARSFSVGRSVCIAGVVRAVGR